MPDPIHKSLTDGRWFELTLYEQLGNIGSEISRALKAKSAGNRERMFKAVDRGLELFDLTIADPRLHGRRKEICRAREVVCDFFYGDNVYRSDGPSLDRYFLVYAMAARLERERARQGGEAKPT